MKLNYHLQPGDRVRPRGVRPVERGRSWVGTVASVSESYPVGSETPYRTLTVQSDLGETWVADQRDWLPATGRDANPRAPGRRYVWIGGIRIGWYDVGVWAGCLLILLFMAVSFPCGIVLGGIPLVMILWSYHQDRRSENLKLAARNRNRERGTNGP